MQASSKAETETPVKTMEAHIYDLQIRVLVYEEDGQVVAHALEMDLMGYGKTDKAAIKELSDLIDCQISFARQMEDDSILAFPAEKQMFERWDKAHLAALKNEIFPDKTAKMKVKAICLPLSAKRRHNSNRRFEPVLACA